MTPVVDVSPWKDLTYMDASMVTGQGFAVVEWPTGRQTVEMYAANVILSRLERCHAMNPDRLQALKEEALVGSMDVFREKTLQTGMWQRQRHGRRKARRFASITWVSPSAYRGPAPCYRGGARVS